ncbi:MAG: dihydroneopterin aldolase [Candidatus Nanopelagicus sp.]
MSDKILIKGISAKGFHGVLKSEQIKGQKFIIDIELILALKNLQDDLNNTVNYAEITGIVVKHITGKPVLLIETLAENIANEVLRQYKKVNSVLVTVHKPKAPIKFKFKDIQVQIEVKR